MIKTRSIPLCVLASFLCSLSAVAQQAAPSIRIVDPIDENHLVTLGHSVHPLANVANDRGAAPDGMQLDRLQLVLQRSPAQEAALRQFIAQMHTPGSSSYHQWLTPDQFAAQFGAADQDIATISSWLGSHGFSVAKVNAGKGTLEFSGSVAQLRDTFHTQIHKYMVNGETHYANANSPQIPAALAPVIGGFASLNNFRIKSQIAKVGRTTYDPSTGKAKSLWTVGGGTGCSSFDYTCYNFVMSPGDFDEQYDLNPVYSQGIKGDGQTIAIINDSNINVGLVNLFRTLFSLPANPPQVIIDGNDPGVDGINNPDGPNYDSPEAYLDVEWSGAVAPDATVDLVIAGDTALESGLILAAERAVYGNVAPVVSLSFGACELELGPTNPFINELWEQAAAQGQTVMVSAGDNGAAGCDGGTDYAVNGQAVNGLGSTPYNVSVGGTDFQYSSYSGTDAAIDAQLQTYWTTTASNNAATTSIKGYIPEQPWNDSQFGLNLFSYYASTGDADTTTTGTGGGASNAALCSSNSYTGTNGECSVAPSGYPKPTWQSGTGVPSDGVRDVPDVSLFSANGYNDSYYGICATDGDCQLPASTVQIYGVGGTSASSPSFAGIMALVNQKYGRQGQADTVLYPLAKQFPAAFHDVIVGNNSVPCAFNPDTPDCIQIAANITAGIYYDDTDQTYGTAEEGQIGDTTNTTVEYNATAGYDLASGLGSVDAAQLLADWGNVTFKSTTTTLTPPNPATVTHGTAVAISGTVTASSGTPTGNVALMTDSTESAQQGVGSANLLSGSASTFALNSSGDYSGSVTTLPGGTYNIWTSYGGDTNNSGSLSSKTQITVNPESTGIAFNLIGPGPQYFTTSIGPSVDYGSQLILSAQVAPTADVAGVQSCLTTTAACPVYTPPTGTITFKDNAAAINTAVINAEGDAEYNAPFAVGAHSVSA
ncbi:MAG: protease pro-enzyme activation domain-containing protein, partial [Terracidiphilus sp.]